MFEAKIETVNELFQYGNTKGAFSIPIYQREYRWKEDDIERFMDDIKEGLLKNDFKRFIGAVILVENKNHNLNAHVRDIIDGQQRITTIILLLVSFYELLKEESGEEYDKDATKDNIVELLIGTPIRKVSKSSEIYPKIIREEDDKREVNDYYSYNSSISKMLHNIGCDFYGIEKKYDDNIESKSINKNKIKIKQKIKEILLDVDDIKKIINYVFHSILFTTVVVKDENYAFDIFESLNSTGEPLTAIETFIPLIVQGEKNYKKSEIKKNVDNILSYIRDKEDSQNISTDLVLWQSLLFDGYDINSRHLSIQRKHLRDKYHSLTVSEDKLLYVSIFKKLVDFIENKWSENSYDSSDFNKLSLIFLNKTKTKLLIPILTRFKDEIDFSDYLRATTAFFTLWRAYTYGTGGIDKAFKEILNEIAFYGENKNINIFQYKKILVEKLEHKILKNKEDMKKEWLLKSKRSPFGRSFKPIGKFILLAAHHEAECKTDKEHRNTGLIIKNKTSRIKTEWLSYKNFEKEKHLKEIEHISPQIQSEGWSSSIYKNKDTIHFIGNLTLLSRSSNSMKSNMTPEHTTIFYKALASGSKKDLEKLVLENKEIFTKKSIGYLNESYKYDFLNCLDGVDFKLWDEDYILKRSENIMSLAWDTIYQWLE